MYNDKFCKEFELLRQNQVLHKRVETYLKNDVKANPNLKGFSYMADIITLSLLLKKYTIVFLKEIYPFIAYKYNIKEYSVQRQLRYTFMIKCEKKITSEKVLQDAWFNLKDFADEMRKENKQNEN